MLINQQTRRLTFTVNLTYLIVLFAFQSVMTSQLDSINTPFDHDVSLVEESSFKDETYELASSIDNFPFINEIGMDMDQTSTPINVDKEKEKVVNNEDVTTAILIDQSSSEPVKLFNHSDHIPFDSNDYEKLLGEENESTKSATTTTTITPTITTTVATSSESISTLSNNVSKVNTGINVNSLLSASICQLVGMLICNQTALICRGSGEIDCDYTNELLAEDDPQKNHCKISKSLTCIPLPLNTFCSGKAQCRQRTNALLNMLGVRELTTTSTIVIVIIVVIVIAVLISQGLIKPAKLKLRSNNEIVPSKQA